MSEPEPTATALITGGAGGLGTAVSEAFVADGWRVVVPSRPGAGSGIDSAPAQVELVSADLFEAAGAARAVERATREAGAPLRAVVNLVGGYAAGARIDATPIEDFEAQFRLNLRPTYLVVSAALPHLIAAGAGAVVCVSSRAALQPFSGAAGYIASKAAVIAFAQSVAVEYRDEGVRCNTVLPSIIDTPANRAAQPNADASRWVAPERIARVIRFLCGPDSEPTSGAAVPVYGRA